MRLREPFAGYNLSQGHALFHVAYLFGGMYAVNVVLNYEEDVKALEEAEEVLSRLNLAHIMVPIFMMIQSVMQEY